MKVLSNILLIANPICGFLMFASFFSPYWFLFWVFPIIIYYNLKLHFYAYRKEHEVYELWLEEFKKDYNYIGLTAANYEIEQVWEHKITKERTIIS